MLQLRCRLPVTKGHQAETGLSKGQRCRLQEHGHSQAPRWPIFCHCSWTSSWIVVTTEPGSASPAPSGAWTPSWVLGTNGRPSKVSGDRSRPFWSPHWSSPAHGWRPQWGEVEPHDAPIQRGEQEPVFSGSCVPGPGLATSWLFNLVIFLRIVPSVPSSEPVQMVSPFHQCWEHETTSLLGGLIQQQLLDNIYEFVMSNFGVSVVLAHLENGVRA